MGVDWRESPLRTPKADCTNLRAQGRLLELRVDRLRFTHQETAEFLNQRMALRLSAGDIETLANRMEGWVVGLQLAALSLKGWPDASAFIHTLSGSHRYILDYLVEEVLSLQAGDVQAFLLQTCILERLCGSLCDALLADETPLPGMEDGADSRRLAACPLPTMAKAILCSAAQSSIRRPSTAFWTRPEIWAWIFWRSEGSRKLERDELGRDGQRHPRRSQQTPSFNARVACLETVPRLARHRELTVL